MISPKQKKILAFPYSHYEALICDGAVRSGKTSLMVVAFIDWAMREFSGQRFGICGKTVGSATENMVIPYISRSYAKQRYTLHWRRSQKILEVRRGHRVNYFEVFGGRDESSFALIQGRTLAGVLLDEVVLMPESFVNQALARCSADGARLWFSCNPGNPSHWFKEEWIDKREEHNALYLHFEMTDNPSLSEKTLARYQSMYHGVFYDRYVRGLWVGAEGLIYPMFTEDRIESDADRQYRKYMISMDYGTRNPTAMILWGLCDGIWYGCKEYYYDSRKAMVQKTDQEYYDDLCKFAGDLPIDHIIIDPSALSFITLVERKHRFKVWDADNDVLDGIRHTAQCISDGTIRICKSCENTIKEFGLYSWDEDATEDRPIKDNDHCLTGDTLVDTVRGPIRIDELGGKCGFVYCAGSATGTGAFHDVRMTQKEAEIFEVTLTDGRSVKATADHPILTRRGWVRIKDLRGDDEIICIGGNAVQKAAQISFVPLSGVRALGKQPVYNMEVDDYHNFSVNGGIIVHNCMDAVRYFVQTTGIWNRKSGRTLF